MPCVNVLSCLAKRGVRGEFAGSPDVVALKISREWACSMPAEDAKKLASAPRVVGAARHDRAEFGREGPLGEGLSRRERQVMDILYRRGHATAAEVREDLEEPPSDSAVRTFLKILEDKGQLRRGREGGRYVYRPARSRQSAAKTALRRVLRTFFDNSTEKAVMALLDVSETKLPQDERERLARLIEQARKEGR